MNYIKNKSGISLVELIVAIGIAGLIIEGVILFVYQGYRSWQYTRDQSEAQSAGRIALGKIVDEIRKAEKDNAGDSVIKTAEKSTLVFHSNIDADSDIERIRYFVENNQFKKGIINPVGILYPDEDEIIITRTNYVTNTDIFTYYKGNGELIEEPEEGGKNDIRLIHIKFVIDIDPNELPRPLTLESSVVLRNLKTNL